MVEKQKFNIIMISIYSPKECGIATYAKNLFLALNKVNPKVNISILAIDELKNKYSQEVKRIIEKEKINSYCEAANYINNSEANLVYIQHEFGIFGKHDGKLLIQLLKNLKVPIVMSLHTVPITKEAKRRKSRIELFKKFSKYCRKIILTTSLAKKTLIAEIGISKNRLKVIYHGTPQVKYITQNKIKDKLKLNNKKVLSSIGLINSSKGINLVVEALPDIIKEHKDVVYLIVGTGTYLSELKKLVDRLNLNNQVIFLGAVSDQTLATLYKLSKIFIMPAKDIQGDVEGFGIVYLDANSFGLPVIAGNTGGVKEAVLDNKTGILIDPNNKGELGQAILKLINDKELYSKMSQAGIKHVVLFNWLKQSKILSDLIEKNG